jgi:hypothetical protein
MHLNLTSSDNKNSHGLWLGEIKSYLFTLVKSEIKTRRCTPTATGIGRNSNNLALDSDEIMEYDVRHLSGSLFHLNLLL